MRILYLNHSKAELATFIRSLELARALTDHGHSVTLCYCHRKLVAEAWFFAMLESLRSPELDIRWPAGVTPTSASERAARVDSAAPRASALVRRLIGSLRDVPSELRLIRETRPDVIVVRSSLSTAWVVAAALARVPVVLSTDGPIEELPHYWGVDSKLLRTIDRWRAHRARALLYISQVCGELWRGKGIVPERLFEVPNGADPAVFAPCPTERATRRRKLGIPEDAMVIGFSGNQRAWHGVGELLQAAAPVLEATPELHVVVVGLVYDAAALQLERVPPAMLEERVTFTGAWPYPEMPQALDLMDIVALPYPEQALFHFSPMKMFEALAMGKVLVASAQGQVAELLSPLASAFLFDPSAAAGLGAALEQAVTALRADPDLGARSRAVAVAAHTWAARGAVVSHACAVASGQGRPGAAPALVSEEVAHAG
jgi:glycosyltransferase involved in cell wall biosynthesis